MLHFTSMKHKMTVRIETPADGASEGELLTSSGDVSSALGVRAASEPSRCSALGSEDSFSDLFGFPSSPTAG